MYHGVREITKEIYDRNKEHGVLCDEDMEKVFTQAQLCGYGVYYTQVRAGKDGKYYVEFDMGDTCD